MSFLLALLTAAIGILPLVVNRKPKPVSAIFCGVVYVLFGWFFNYFTLPSSVAPVFGSFGLGVLLCWVISASVHCWRTDQFKWTARSLIFPIGLTLVFVGVWFSNTALFRHDDLAKLIGPVETREWTQDVQPKDPRHVRLVPKELAVWLATKQLGSMSGAIGSQFQIYEYDMTLQRINGELWYAAPLDFKGYRAWTSAKVSPGYVLVHGEDPRRQPIVKSGQNLTYTLHASFGKLLPRLLWQHGYWKIGLTHYSFEIDEAGKAWYVVTMYKPTIGWGGKRVTGILLVDPQTGDIQPYQMGNIPSWIDRVVPPSFVSDYIDKYGAYRNGFVNTIWGHHDIFESETPTISYGSDENIYWVTSVTSNNAADDAMIGVYYTNVHTGRSVYYHAAGGTEDAILKAVNNTIGYRNWHGAGPVLYNIYGTMASIVPVLGENQTFQGVAIVNVGSLKVSFGETEYDAYRSYERDLELAGQSIAPENFHDSLVLEGRIARFASDIRGGVTTYYFIFDESPQIFMGGSERSVELPLTRLGDQVKITYDVSTEAVVPVLTFDNLMMDPPSILQQDLQQRVSDRQQGLRDGRQAQAVRDTLSHLSDSDLLKRLQK